MAKPELTKDQREAVEHRGSALLVSAAAGSGKTKVLVDRLLSQICDPVSPCNVDDFLIITYTKAAAAELRSKIAAEIGRRLSEDSGNRHLRSQLTRIYLAEISTVHAFCSGLLRSYAYLLDIPADFRVAEEAEARQLRQRAVEQTLVQAYENLQEHPQVAALMDSLGYGRDDRKLGGLILDAHDKVQCHVWPKKWLEDCRSAISCQDAESISETIWGKYLLSDMQQFLSQQILRMEGAVAILTGVEELSKCRDVLQKDLDQLRRLAEAPTWDAFARSDVVTFAKWPVVRGCQCTELKQEAKNIRDACKKHLEKRLQPFSCDGETAFRELKGTQAPLLGLLYLVEQYAKEYSQLKRQRRILDFSDLEHYAVRLLTDSYTGKPTAAALEISQRFQEIMVDEYQDSNQVQDTIFRALSKNETNLFMVGDVKQSIYRFRLADPGIFLDKYHRYEAREDPSGDAPRKLLLSHNFRSRGEILQAVNHVFSAVMSEQVGDLEYGDTEALRTIREFPEISEPAVELHLLNAARDPEDMELGSKTEAEACFVAKRIRQLLDGDHYITDGDGLRRIRPEDIVILMRSVSSTAPVFMRELARYGILSSSDRSSSILDTTEISTLLAWLQIIDNPHQDIPLLTALASPLGGFSADDLAKIRAENRRDDLFDALTKFACGREKYEEFLLRLSLLREKSLWMPLPEFFDHVCSETSVFEIFGSGKDGLVRSGNLQRFRELCRSAESIGIENLSGFIRYVEGLKEQGLVVSTDSSVSAGVSIMSIHKSKGLEFPVVFLCDLSRRFNTEDLRVPVLMDQQLMIGCNIVDRELMVQYPSTAKYAISAKKKKDMISEELRVLYVAMTRAKDRLIMTYCAANLENQLQKIAADTGYPVQSCVSADVSCPGQWVLLAAAVREEAVHVFGGVKSISLPKQSPWLIRYHASSEEFPETELQAAVRDLTAQTQEVCLDSSYAYASATTVPAKITATQLKGRDLDVEASEQAAQEIRYRRVKVQPRIFAPGQKQLSASQKGTAMHLFMQYCRYENCSTMEGISTEKARLLEKSFLTQQQIDAVEEEKILRFFCSPVGQLVTNGEVHREFKFSLLTDASAFYADVSGEQIMLQGVVDCFVISHGTITVVDYKTDRICSGQENARTEEYKPQIMAYSAALERIYGLPVVRRIVYYFATGESCEV